jgi:hypothetical protein
MFEALQIQQFCICSNPYLASIQFIRIVIYNCPSFQPLFNFYFGFHDVKINRPTMDQMTSDTAVQSW